MHLQSAQYSPVVSPAFQRTVTPKQPSQLQKKISEKILLPTAHGGSNRQMSPQRVTRRKPNKTAAIVAIQAFVIRVVDLLLPAHAPMFQLQLDLFIFILFIRTLSQWNYFFVV